MRVCVLRVCVHVCVCAYVCVKEVANPTSTTLSER